jgi:hypothetical protein
VLISCLIPQLLLQGELWRNEMIIKLLSPSLREEGFRERTIIKGYEWVFKRCARSNLFAHTLGFNTFVYQFWIF